MQAVVLVEACLSVGLQARTIALHPLSPYDLEQHYVTVVWTGPSSQWVMLDPSFGSCFRDPDGTILSPWQLRAWRERSGRRASAGGTAAGRNMPRSASARYDKGSSPRHSRRSRRRRPAAERRSMESLDQVEAVDK